MASEICGAILMKCQGTMGMGAGRNVWSGDQSGDLEQRAHGNITTAGRVLLTTLSAL